MFFKTVLLAGILQCATAGILMPPMQPDQGTIDTGANELTAGERALPRRALTPEEKALNMLCAEKCTMEKCYLRHDADCGNYILCEKGAKDFTYRGQVLPCAFGTYWAGLALQQKMTCDIPQNVVCNIKPCDNMPIGYKYGTEWNCKAYWECGPKGPEPKCCGGDEFAYFDPAVGECVRNKNTLLPCFKKCPIKTDACSVPGTMTAVFPDDNCLTYWDCQDRRPHPVCCPPGESYDELTQACNPGLPCADTCPSEYQPDICQRQNTYMLHDGRCGTFMKCNAVEGDERWCCMAGDYYDSQDKVCRKREPGMIYNCVDECPEGYNVECHLQAIPGNPSMYRVMVNEFAYNMTCAPGTAFREDICTCGVRLLGAQDNSCNMELDIEFDSPTWIRIGSQRFTSINEYGSPKPGNRLNNMQAFRFDGSLYYRVSFFQQSMPALYIHIVFLPGPTDAGQKQALVSNCQALEGGSPSVELALENGKITLSLVASSQENPNTGNVPVTLSVPYQTLFLHTPKSPANEADDWNVLTVIYDGESVSMTNNRPARALSSEPMTGEIKVAAEGLDVGGCTGQTLMFKGDLAKIQISKCVHNSWKQKFRDITADRQATV